MKRFKYRFLYDKACQTMMIRKLKDIVKYVAFASVIALPFQAYSAQAEHKSERTNASQSSGGWAYQRFSSKQPITYNLRKNPEKRGVQNKPEQTRNLDELASKNTPQIAARKPVRKRDYSELRTNDLASKEDSYSKPNILEKKTCLYDSKIGKAKQTATHVEESYKEKAKQRPNKFENKNIQSGLENLASSQTDKSTQTANTNTINYTTPKQVMANVPPAVSANAVPGITNSVPLSVTNAPYTGLTNVVGEVSKKASSSSAGLTNKNVQSPKKLVEEHEEREKEKEESKRDSNKAGKTECKRLD